MRNRSLALSLVLVAGVFIFVFFQNFSASLNSADLLACKADLNGNGFVNAQDIAIFRLDAGTNNLRSDVDGNGFVNARDYTIIRSALGTVCNDNEVIFLGPVAPALKTPSGIALSEKEKFAYITDYNLKALIAVNLETGEQNIVSNAEVGTGPLFGSVHGITIHHESKTAFVAVANLGSSYIMKVDLSNGNRSIVSSNQIGTGPSMTAINDVIVNPLGTELFSSDINDGAIYRVSVESGNRSYLKSPLQSQFASIIYSLYANTNFTHAYAINGRNDSIFRIDLVSGAIVMVSNATIGAGPIFNSPHAIARGTSQQYAYVSDYGLSAIFKINLTNGDRTIISDSTTGVGPVFDRPTDIAVNAEETVAYVLNDSHENKLIRVDLLNGNRVPLD